MEADVLISLVVILLPLSFIAERFSNLIKLYMPIKGKYTLGNLRNKEGTDWEEKIRERKILLVSIISGEIVAFAVKADLFTILETGKIGWNIHTGNGIWIIGCLFTGFFLSWGSKFWHDLLGIMLEVKNIRKATLEDKNLDLQVKSGQLEDVSISIPVEQPDAPPPPPATAPNLSGIAAAPAMPALSVDKTTIKRIDNLHPKVRDEVKAIYNDILAGNVPIRITDSLRSIDEQNALYEQGRSKPGKIVTHAKGGQSYHNYGLAVDFCLLVEGGKKASWDRNVDRDKDKQSDWKEVVTVFKHYGWEWGGDWNGFKDYPHFQKTFGHTTAQLFDKYNKGEKDTEGYVKVG